MTNTEIIMKLVSQIQPVGMSHVDGERLDNLKELCSLVEELNTKIYNVASNHFHNNEHSIVLCQEYAKKFLIDQAKQINDGLL